MVVCSLLVHVGFVVGRLMEAIGAIFEGFKMNTLNSKTSFFFIILLLILTFCPGCSYIQYERNGLKVTGFEFGTDKALSGFSYETPEGRVTVESLDKNQTAGISAIAEGIVKGAIKGAK